MKINYSSMGYVILPKIKFLAFVATLIGFQFLVTGCNSSTNVFYLEDEQLYIRLEKGYTPDSSRVLLGRNMSDIDYHWYMQDKGGQWSSKHGKGFNVKVDNLDASKCVIRNPKWSNHNYRHNQSI